MRRARGAEDPVRPSRAVTGSRGPGFGLSLREAPTAQGFAPRAELQTQDGLSLRRPCSGRGALHTSLFGTSLLPSHRMTLTPHAGVETSLTHPRSHACCSLHVSFLFP